MATLHDLDAFRATRNEPRSTAKARRGSGSTLALIEPQPWIDPYIEKEMEIQPDVLREGLRSVLALSLLATAIALCVGFADAYIGSITGTLGMGGALLRVLLIAVVCIASMLWIVSYLLWLMCRD